MRLDKIASAAAAMVTVAASVEDIIDRIADAVRDAGNRKERDELADALKSEKSLLAQAIVANTVAHNEPAPAHDEADAAHPTLDLLPPAQEGEDPAPAEG